MADEKTISWTAIVDECIEMTTIVDECIEMTAIVMSELKYPSVAVNGQACKIQICDLEKENL